MHPLHDYVAKQLADKLKDRRVVVGYTGRITVRSPRPCFILDDETRDLLRCPAVI